ncbi:MAG: glycosyltransferase family 39 protein [Chloroflexi bacterium]|nr:glycosyltransferase family 39 protein [Chloroflexota bacterium]
MTDQQNESEIAVPAQTARPLPAWVIPVAISAILLAALLLRVYYFDTTVQVPQGGDQGEYYGRAAMLAGGDGYYDPAKWVRPPLYIFFLAGVFKLFGYSVLDIRLVQVVLGLTAVLLVYGIARRIAGERSALVAMAACALYLPLATISNLVMSETLFIVLLLGAMYALTRWSVNGSRLLWLPAGGVLLGLATLTRSYALLFLPLAAIWVWLSARREKHKGWTTVAVFLIAFVMVVSPWTLRNALVYHSFIPVDTTGGYNFLLANGGFQDKSEMEKVLLPIAGYAERDRYAYQQALSYMVSHPRQALESAVTNAFYLAKLEYLPDLIRVDKGVSWGERAASTLLGDIPFLAALALGPAGLFLSGRRRPAALFGAWLGFCFVLALFTPVDFIGLRYRLPMMPFLIIGLACFAVTVVERAFRWRKQWWASAALALAVLFVILELFAYQNVPLVLGRVLDRQSLETQADQTYLVGDYGNAEKFYQAALSLQPDFLDARLGLANTLLATGKTNEAAKQYEMALQVNPYDPRSHGGLGEIYRRAGDTSKTAKQFNVDDEAALLDWTFKWLPVQSRQRVDVGYLDAGYVDGFWPAENKDSVSYRRARENAEVRFGPIATADEVSIRMASLSPNALPVQVLVNGKDVGTAKATEDFQLFTFKVADVSKANTPLTVEFRSQMSEEGDGSDARYAGVAVDWVSVKTNAGGAGE